MSFRWRSLVLALLLAASPASSQEKNAGGVDLAEAPRRVPRSIFSDVFASVDVPQAIPDNDPAGITSTLEVPGGLHEIIDVNLIVGSLPHTCLPDLHIELTSPSETNSPLILHFGEQGILSGADCGTSLTETVFDDEAPTNFAAGTSPFTGSFNIEHASVAAMPLSAFDGEAPGGTWTLEVSDRAAFDFGTLEGWSLEITTETLDALQCYKAKDLKQPAFVKLNDLPVVNEIQTGVVDVKRPALVCLPADVDGSGVSEPNVAECCYKTKGTMLKPAVDTVVTDAFGTHHLALSKPDLVCQPCSVQGPP